MLVSPGMELVSAVMAVMTAREPGSAPQQATHGGSAAALVRFFHGRGRSLDLLRWALARDIANHKPEVHGTVPFRATTAATRLLAAFYRLEAQPYLDHCLGPSIQSLCTTPQPLLSVLKSLVDCVLSSAPHCPQNVRLLVAHARSENAKRFPEDPRAPSAVVGVLVFLRLLVPATMTPEAYGLLPAPPPTETARRSCVSLARVLQWLANGAAASSQVSSSSSGAEDDEMRPLLDYAAAQVPRLISFFDALTRGCEAPAAAPAVRDDARPVAAEDLDEVLAVLLTGMPALAQHLAQGGHEVLAERLRAAVDELAALKKQRDAATPPPPQAPASRGVSPALLEEELPPVEGDILRHLKAVAGAMAKTWGSRLKSAEAQVSLLTQNNKKLAARVKEAEDQVEQARVSRFLLEQEVRALREELAALRGGSRDAEGSSGSSAAPPPAAAPSSDADDLTPVPIRASVSAGDLLRPYRGAAEETLKSTGCLPHLPHMPKRSQALPPRIHHLHLKPGSGSSRGPTPPGSPSPAATSASASDGGLTPPGEAADGEEASEPTAIVDTPATKQRHGGSGEQRGLLKFLSLSSSAAQRKRGAGLLAATDKQ
eukprot:m51a1_g9149 putative ras gtpase activation domain-containing protein (599) ;mRNA; f:96421-98618